VARAGKLRSTSSDPPHGPLASIRDAQPGLLGTLANQRDGDGDGCKDQREIGRLIAGSPPPRDPVDGRDYREVTGDNTISIGDISAVVSLFGRNVLAANYPGVNADTTFSPRVPGPDGAIHRRHRGCGSAFSALIGGECA